MSFPDFTCMFCFPSAKTQVWNKTLWLDLLKAVELNSAPSLSLSPCLCKLRETRSGFRARFRGIIWLGCTELLPGMQPWQVAKPFLVMRNVTVTRTASYQLWALIAKTSVSRSTWILCSVSLCCRVEYKGPGTIHSSTHVSVYIILRRYFQNAGQIFS